MHLFFILTHIMLQVSTRHIVTSIELIYLKLHVQQILINRDTYGTNWSELAGCSVLLGFIFYQYI